MFPPDLIQDLGFITWKMSSLVTFGRMPMMSSHSWHRSSWRGIPKSGPKSRGHAPSSREGGSLRHRLAGPTKVQTAAHYPIHPTLSPFTSSHPIHSIHPSCFIHSVILSHPISCHPIPYGGSKPLRPIQSPPASPFSSPPVSSWLVLTAPTCPQTSCRQCPRALHCTACSRL